MVDSEGLWYALGMGAFGAGAFGLARYVKYRISHGSPKHRKKMGEIKEQNLLSLDALVTVGEMDRLWYNAEDNCYRDAAGKQVSTQPLRQDLEILKSYNPEGLASLLMEMACKGKALKADAYSLSSPQDIHGEYTLGVLYHRFQEVGSKPELRLVDSVAKHK